MLMPANRLQGLARPAAMSLMLLGALSAMSMPRDREVMIPAGLRLVGTLRQTISTETTPIGAPVAIRTTQPFVVEDVRIPAGLVFRGEVVEARDGGRVSGRAALTLEFTQLSLEGREYQVTTRPFRVVGRSETKNSIKKLIGGAVAGGVVGAIAGDTKKGVLVGTVVGGGAAVASRGGHITLPAGQRIEIRLSDPVRVMVRTDNAYPDSP